MSAEPQPPLAPDGSLAVGRRASARLRLALPGRFTAISGTQNCIIVDLSRTGARLAVVRPIPAGQQGYVELGRFELFGSIVRLEQRSGGGLNAISFDEPLAKAQVLEIRRYAEHFAERESAALREQARRWVNGQP